MSAPTVQVETRGAVALVTLNRPENANTLNLQMAMDLLAAALACARNAAVRAVVLTGAGRNFCFGGDLRAMASRETAADDYIRELTTYLHAAIAHFTRMDAPVIAAVNGTAAGAGVGLVAMADIALCTRGSKFNLAYTNAGLTPDAGTSFLLPRIIGARRTMVKSVFCVSMPISRKCRFTHSHAPRAVMPIFLWSYPAEPPEANASPSQKSYSAAMALAMSEKVAVPLSAATTR